MMERVTGSKDGRVDHSLQVSPSMIIFFLVRNVYKPLKSMPVFDLLPFALDNPFLLMQDKTFRHPYLSAIGSHT